MSVPQKFRAIGDFHEYYSGARKAPYLTLFVGGNHEASSHLQELHYGGWVAPNIFYLGAANVVRFGDLRIAGLSGIWKGYNYNKPHFEKLPYDENEIKSLYHVREIDVRKLLLLRTQVDIGISHDWPRGIEWQGDYKALFRKKDLFEADAKAGTLGSSAARYVMDRLRPPYWFSAHLHCKFAATVEHERGYQETHTVDGENHGKANSAIDTDQIEGAHLPNDVNVDLDGQQLQQNQKMEHPASIKNEDEIDLDIDDEDPSSVPSTPTFSTPIQPTSQVPLETDSIPSDIRSQLPAAFTRPKSPPRQTVEKLPPPVGITNTRTQFLALDKCLPNRKFLQILSIQPLKQSDPPAPLCLSYDEEWLAILRVFASHDPHQPNPHNLGEAAYAPLIDKEETWVEENIVKKNGSEMPGNMAIPDNFEFTAPVYDGRLIGSVGRQQPQEYSNPQTQRFCEMLQIPNWFDDNEDVREERRRAKGARIESESGRGGDRGRGRGRGHGGGRGGGRRGRGRGGGGGF